MYNAEDPWMSVDDGRGRLVGRHCRPSPSWLKKTAPFPSCPWTDGTVDFTGGRKDSGWGTPLPSQVMRSGRGK